MQQIFDSAVFRQYSKTTKMKDIQKLYKKLHITSYSYRNVEKRDSFDIETHENNGKFNYSRINRNSVQPCFVGTKMRLEIFYTLRT